MSRDVKFWKEDGSFKLRVCGIIKSNDKYLINDCDNSGFYSFPGGHVHIGENTDCAVIREVNEETNFDTEIVKLLAIEQLFFSREDGKPFHEICYYYLLSTKNFINTKDFKNEEMDNGVLRHHSFLWRNLQELKTLDVRPKNIIDILENNMERQHLIRSE